MIFYNSNRNNVICNKAQDQYHMDLSDLENNSENESMDDFTSLRESAKRKGESKKLLHAKAKCNS